MDEHRWGGDLDGERLSEQLEAGPEPSKDRFGFWVRMLSLAALAAAAVFASRLQWGPDPAETSKPLPALGDPAPAFTLRAADGSEVTPRGVTSSRPALFYFSMGPG